MGSIVGLKFHTIALVLTGLFTWKCSYSGMCLLILTSDPSLDSEIGRYFTGGANDKCWLLLGLGPCPALWGKP
jgi:hypothetical protein